VANIESFFPDLWKDLITFDERVAEMDKKVHAMAQSEPAAKRLLSIPGIGPINATAIICAVGDGLFAKQTT
jgi:transposase